MVREKTERSEVWWLAYGHSSKSRQPSFAPSTARASVTHSSYGFGWHREKQCFVATRKHGLLSPTSKKYHECDPEIAREIIHCCGHERVHKRFFDTPYSSDGDENIYCVNGWMFRISLDKYGSNRSSEVNLYFYSPVGKVQRVGFHNGMTRSFGSRVKGMGLSDIEVAMK